MNSPTLIISDYRSGSTWIAELLLRNGGPDCRQEIFGDLQQKYTSDPGRENRESLQLQIREILLRREEDKVGQQWGFKLMISGLIFLTEIFESTKNAFDFLDDLFPNCVIIEVVRQASLEQAISLYIAKTTGTWHQYEHNFIREKLSDINVSENLSLKTEIEEGQKYLRHQHQNSSRNYLSVAYEDALKDVHRTVRSLLLHSMAIDRPDNQLFVQIPLLKNDPMVRAEIFALFSL